jgi:hypothetical protein
VKSGHAAVVSLRRGRGRAVSTRYGRCPPCRGLRGRAVSTRYGRCPPCRGLRGRAVSTRYGRCPPCRGLRGNLLRGWEIDVLGAFGVRDPASYPTQLVEASSCRPPELQIIGQLSVKDNCHNDCWDGPEYQQEEVATEDVASPYGPHLGPLEFDQTPVLKPEQYGK